MKPEAITRAQALPPATLAELAKGLGLTEDGTRYTLKQLLKGGYAELWGDKLTEKGTLAPVIHSTGKTPS